NGFGQYRRLFGGWIHPVFLHPFPQQHQPIQGSALRSVGQYLILKIFSKEMVPYSLRLKGSFTFAPKILDHEILQ
ncbi:MAG: hypothetical protein ACI9YL_001320, partial [Luteibaculaceae bacterium]